MAILFACQQQKPASWLEATPISAKRFTSNVKELLLSTRIAHKFVLKPHTQHRVVFSAFTSGTCSVKDAILGESMEMMSAAYSVVVATPLQPFHNLLSNFSANAVHLHERMVVAYGTDPPTAVKTSRSSLH